MGACNIVLIAIHASAAAAFVTLLFLAAWLAHYLYHRWYRERFPD